MRASSAAGLVLFLLLAIPVSTFGEVARAARAENKRGLAHHRAGRFDKALASFEKAVEIDPAHHLARFNAACAAAKGGDLERARRHAKLYLDARPTDGTRLLHDADLEALRSDSGWMAALRKRLRPVGARVRPIVFERLEGGGDLYAIGEDGLDEIPIAVTPGAREYGARFTPDGGRLLYLKSRRPRKGQIYDVSALGGRRILHEPDEELWSQPFPSGKAVLLAKRVHGFELDRDGGAVLFVDRPRKARTSKDVLRLRRVAVTGGDVETLGELDVRGGQHCVAQEASGAILVAEGVPRTDYRRGLDVSLTRFDKGKRTVLLEPAHPGWKTGALTAFTACELRQDGSGLHLGGARISLGDKVSIHWMAQLELAHGENMERVLTGRGAMVPGPEPAFIVTVIGEQRSTETHPAPPFWKVSQQSGLLGGGMCDPWWYRTSLKRYPVWRGGDMRTLTSKRTFIEYAPAVSTEGDALAFTRLTSVAGVPWVVVAKLDGSGDRRVAPGQYPVWGPLPLVAKTAGARLLGPRR